MEIISNMNKSASWFLPVMKEMHHRCSWCSCGGSPRKKHHREGGPRELNQRAPRFQRPGKFQIWFSMPKRLLYPWISSKLFRLNLWPRKAVKPHVNHTPPMPKNGTVETVETVATVPGVRKLQKLARNYTENLRNYMENLRNYMENLRNYWIIYGKSQELYGKLQELYGEPHGRYWNALTAWQISIFKFACPLNIFIYTPLGCKHHFPAHGVRQFCGWGWTKTAPCRLWKLE